MANIDRSVQRSGTKAYLVGGGIASLASAAYLIRDGGLNPSSRIRA
jgi:oleate hydratase